MHAEAMRLAITVGGAVVLVMCALYVHASQGMKHLKTLAIALPVTAVILANLTGWLLFPLLWAFTSWKIIGVIGTVY